MKRIAVYCGSSFGASEAYKNGAVQLGKELAKQKITLVYGGSSNGLMGAVADAALQEGGHVIGVIPRVLEEREISHKGLTELHTVETMHERKAKMAELADGFIVLPGGAGTLEEFFEVFTWGQIGLHQKPCGILNIHHYYDPLKNLIDHMIEQKFLQEKFRSMVIFEEQPDVLLDQFSKYVPPSIKNFK
ncbi:TIGR00730 family Rossman fold protein [Neobacillus drentensis]|uniref:LOG family protein n=1 Tax=Neobacillus drentensis TaxID=220684 RepID=UPI002FFDF99B